MIFQERSLHFRLVVLIVCDTGGLSVTLVGKFNLDECTGYLWFLHFQQTSRANFVFLKALTVC